MSVEPHDVQSPATENPIQEPAAAEPHAAASAESPPAEPSASSGAPEAEGETRPGRRIKIGTQRPGAFVPKAKPLPLPAAAVKAKTGEGVEPRKRPPRPRREDEAGGRESQSGPATAVEEGESVEAMPARPVSRGREPMPNLRERSPELQEEIDAALGGISLDEIAAGDASQPVGASLESGGKLTARVVTIHNDDVFVELGQRNQGVLSLRQFTEPPAVGTQLEVVVGSFNAEEGLYSCSLPGGAVEVEDWSQLMEGTVVEATVTGHNKGGLEVEVNRIRGFIPAGQISLYRVEDFSQFVGQKFACVVTEANPRRQNLILSRRAVLEREKAEAREKLFAELGAGQVREGIVRKLMDFGAFVDIGGVDGLLHVSRMSWQRVRHPSELLKEGDQVRVQVEKIDPETRKISLSMREFKENPWESVGAKYAAKTVIRGNVTKIMDFGAFVELEPGVEGLVHISELAHHRVFRVSDVVKEGQEVEAEVLSVDRENQRISLSLKALQARPAPQQAEEQPGEAEAPPPPKPKSNIKLKGGLGRSPGAQQWGLKW
jgi:small subunit ribosomal protein S1